MEVGVRKTRGRWQTGSHRKLVLRGPELKDAQAQAGTKDHAWVQLAKQIVD